jgi:hypothetical protein
MDGFVKIARLKKVNGGAVWLAKRGVHFLVIFKTAI